ncbi:MAG: hypothetical protein QOE37_1640 [Microbacteriaceae bacterium]|jgi:hypothetical protein|nr:hypothetical protein [Microbacteriaceae bacterium]
MAEEFVILIVEQPWDPATVTEEQWTAATRAHQAFAEAVVKAGAQVLGGDALQSPSTAVRITPANGDRAPVFTDGPFADTKEVITGYYKIAARDAQQARELGALCPSGGYLEVYPVMNTAAM